MNKFIRDLINEQFNIGNMNLTDNKPKHNMNIFNKNTIDFNKIYKTLLKGKISKNEIYQLNDFISVIKPKDRVELKKIVDFYSNNYPEESLNWIDVSEITDMSHLFAGFYNGMKWIYNNYNGDISLWNVSGVLNMGSMFFDSTFNQDISNWNTSNATTMKYMFAFSSFTQDISGWNVSHVKDMSYMFYTSSFNMEISGWNTSNVKNMSYMFSNSIFNQDISGWDVHKVNNWEHIFNECPINEEYKPEKFIE